MVDHRHFEHGLGPFDCVGVGTLTGEDYKQGGHIIGGTPKVFAALVAEIAPLVPKNLALLPD